MIPSRMIRIITCLSLCFILGVTQDIAIAEVAEDLVFLLDREIDRATEEGSTDKTVQKQYSQLRSKLLHRFGRIHHLHEMAAPKNKLFISDKVHLEFTKLKYYTRMYLYTAKHHEMTKQRGIEGFYLLRNVLQNIKTLTQLY